MSTRATHGTGLIPSPVKISDAQIEDLRSRLRQARLPEPQTVNDGSQGVPLQEVTHMCRWWLEEHDWRKVEAEINRYEPTRTQIEGLGIHFLHARSKRSDARPLLMSHGWPGSIVEFLDILPALIDPPGNQPAFHVVLPSLPGYGFSDKPTSPGWGLERIADAWVELMARLGYPRFLAQGGDWGAMITTTVALRHPNRIAMMHTTVPWASKPPGFADADLTETEKRWLAELAEFRSKGGGYAAVMSTRPQTFGYGLVDSPVGQLAWILEAYLGHGDTDDHGRPLIPRHRILDNAALYWFSASAASSARLYWESLGKMDMTTPVTVPSAVSVFRKELMKLPRSWVEARYTDLRHWAALGRGGHFAMLEVPEPFVAELRGAFSHAPA
jgi:epoxide hydrolase